MATETSCMLFCPPLPPLRLSLREPAAVGRHTSCQLVIRKDDVSRRHAEVYFDSGAFLVRDLGSTNGTFLNGTCVEQATRLQGGDHIEIGSSTITFCNIDSSFANIEDGPRTARERGDAFRGDLAKVPTDALLQLLEIGHESGLLELTTANGTGMIFIDRGRLVHAATEKRLGFDAAMELVGASVGRFCFQPGVTSETSTIVASITELLLEASRAADEANR